MSYSFSVRAASKVEALALVAQKLTEVVQAQPTHSIDMASASRAVESFVALLPDDDSKDVAISVNGSISTLDGVPRSAGFGVSVYLPDRA